MPVRFPETGCGALITSMFRRAPKGSMCETISCCFAGGPVIGRGCAN